MLKPLGNSDLRISSIGLGTWAIGGDGVFGWGPQDDAESIAAILRSAELGINWIDTAPIYGFGHAEQIVGQALKQLDVEAHEAIIFEDSEHGVSAAKAAGIFCVAVPNKVTRCLTFANPSLIVSSIADYSLHDYTERAALAR